MSATNQYYRKKVAEFSPWDENATPPWEREFCHWTEAPAVFLHFINIRVSKRLILKWIYVGRRHRGAIYRLRTHKVMGLLMLKISDVKAFIDACTATREEDMRMLRAAQAMAKRTHGDAAAGEEAAQ